MNGCQGLGGRELVFNGNRISVLQDEVLEIYYTTMWIYLTLLNCILKNGYNGNLMLHAFFFTIKNKTKLFKALQLANEMQSLWRLGGETQIQGGEMTQPEGKPAIAQGVSSVTVPRPQLWRPSLVEFPAMSKKQAFTSFSLTVFLRAKCYCFCCSVDEEFGKSWEMKLSKCCK